MSLTVRYVREDPVLAFASYGPNGEELAAKVYAGECQVYDVVGERLMAKLAQGRAPGRLGFYVPKAGPLTPSYQLAAWAEMSLAHTQIASGDLAQQGPYGVADAVVQFIEDDKGLGSQWPYLWFTVYGGEPMVLRYRVTVTRPVD